MGYTLGKAAKATGKSKTTILRAIQKSKISAAKDVHGNWSIEPAELHRVYPAVTGGNGAADDRATTGNADLRNMIRILEAQSEDLRQERDEWREQAKRLLLDRPETRRLSWRERFAGKIV